MVPIELNLNNINEHKNRSQYMNNQWSFGHNPITNPVPFNNQNPYMVREIKSINSNNHSNHIFSNNAANNILK